MAGRGWREVIALSAVLLASLAAPAPALANMGPPSLFLYWGALYTLVVEVVVIAIETPLLRHFLGLSFGRSFGAAAAGNGVSTIIGIPVAIASGDVIGPAFGESWMVPGIALDIGAAVSALAVFFACSFLIELPVVRLVSRSDWRRTAFAVAAANAISHLGMLALLVALELL